MPGLEARTCTVANQLTVSPLQPLGHSPSCTCAHSPVKFTSARLSLLGGLGRSKLGAEGAEEKAHGPCPPEADRHTDNCQV